MSARLTRGRRVRAAWAPVVLALASAPWVAGAAHAAAAPSALVESVSAPLPGVTVMGYLSSGMTLDLGSGTTLVLDYLSQCVRETIVSGIVTIGTDNSTVQGGHISRRRLDCDGGDLQIAADLSEQGAVTEYRAVGDPAALVVRSTAPVVIPHEPGKLIITRLDRSEPDIVLQVAADGTGGKVVDVAAAAHSLAPGGKYRATLGTRSMIFAVDPNAAGAEAPLLARILPL